mgnify:FL=1|tara:strand:- start:108 stop:380 length:273 start_codon:yes stop_codon:yes gene_type:complete
MIEAVLVVICVIALYMIWEALKYSKQIKEDERINQQDFIRVNQEREGKPSSNSKTSKDKAQSKRKYRSLKEENVKSKNVKKNARRNKKKV